MKNLKKILVALSIFLLAFTSLPHLTYAQAAGGTCSNPDFTTADQCTGSGYTWTASLTPPATTAGGTCSNPDFTTADQCTGSGYTWTATGASAATNAGNTTPAGALVPCTNTCGFNDLLTLVANVVHFILFKMAVPIAAILFCYAGVKYITAGGDAHQAGEAKKIFMDVALGFIIAVAAWLIISLVLKLLGYNASWIGF